MYGGTKTEMERLIADANAVKEANGEMADLTIDRFADVVEAIHIIQTEMGITGTTAAEAAKTISGSAGAMKASWRNLMTAFAADNKDVKKAISEFAESAKTFSDNLLPRIEETLEGMAEAVEELTPIIGDAFEVLFDSFFDFLPKIVDLGEGIVSTLVESIYNNQSQITTAASGILSAIVSFITNETPKLIQLGADIMLSLVEGFASNPTGIIKAVSDAMNSILSTVLDFTEKMQEPGSKIMEELANGFDLYDMANKIGQIIANIILFLSDNAPLIVDMGFELLGGLINGLTASGNIERFVVNITKLVQYLAQKIIDNKEEIVGSAIEILERFASALEENKTIQAIINAISSVVLAIAGELTTKANLDKVGDVGGSIVKALGEGIANSAPSVLEYLPTLLGNIVGYLVSEDFLNLIIDCGVELGKSLIKGISETVTQWFINDFGAIIGGIFGEEGINFITDLQTDLDAGLLWGENEETRATRSELWEGLYDAGLDPNTFLSGQVVVVNQYISSEAQTAADLMEEALIAQQRGLALN